MATMTIRTPHVSVESEVMAEAEADKAKHRAEYNLPYKWIVDVVVSEADDGAFLVLDVNPPSSQSERNVDAISIHIPLDRIERRMLIAALQETLAPTGA